MADFKVGDIVDVRGRVAGVDGLNVVIQFKNRSGTAEFWFDPSVVSLVDRPWRVGDRVIEKAGDACDPVTLVYVGDDGMVVNRAGRLEVVTGKLDRAPER